ncbi:MAG: hypothetical protein EOP06_05280 [Proteobacteria bacterium]|nr:MAG: hypothetical protein EOP06_05280 [Pseudomonadota bacterium]
MSFQATGLSHTADFQFVSSGDGAYTYSFSSDGRRLEPEDVMRLARIHAPELIDQGYAAKIVSGDVRLVPPVFRVSEAKLSVKGRTYTYYIDDQAITGALKPIELNLISDDLDSPVKNFATLSAACFFLNYEHQLA